MTAPRQPDGVVRPGAAEPGSEVPHLAGPDALPARDELVQKHLGLVGSVSRRFTGLGYDHEDLFQVGCIGLVKAAERFDPDYGVQFSTYAVPLILGEIRRFLRDDGPVKVSRGLQQLARQARATEEELTRQFGREASATEVAAALDVPVAEVVAAMDTRRPLISLQAPPGGDGVALEDRLGTVSPMPATDDRLALEAALAGLEPRDRELIVRRFFENETQTVIAADFGISQVQVSRLERRALAQLRLMLSG